MAERYALSSPEIAILERRYEIIERAAARLYPALLLEAKGYIIRARREYAGELLDDAALSTAEASRVLAELEDAVHRRSRL